MYAVFSTGGKQYRATTGDIIRVEKLDVEKGATVELDQVLMVGEGEDVNVGSPLVKGGKVTATVVEHGRGDKVKIIKFKRRKNYLKQMGHRQYFTMLEITGIEGAGAAKPKKAEAKKAAAPAEEKSKKAAKPKVEAKAEPVADTVKETAVEEVQAEEASVEAVEEVQIEETAAEVTPAEEVAKAAAEEEAPAEAEAEAEAEVAEEETAEAEESAEGEDEDGAADEQAEKKD